MTNDENQKNDLYKEIVKMITHHNLLDIQNIYRLLYLLRVLTITENNEGVYEDNLIQDLKLNFFDEMKFR